MRGRRCQVQRELSDEGKVIRLGYGAYARAEISRLSNIGPYSPAMDLARHRVKCSTN